ncbi:hypothetical protein [Micromonospora sp. DT231]|uniref:hypothetical protein n=1 Tax=Micromonospora sp. DT231 TaxID=3416526 RepID=UPI003CF3ED44
METLAYACQTAYLDRMNGSGLLVRSLPEGDVAAPVEPGKVPVALSAHEADWNAAIRDLDARGWEPGEDGEGGFALDSTMSDGREVGLYGREPVIDEPDMERIAESFAELCRLAGSID